MAALFLSKAVKAGRWVLVDVSHPQWGWSGIVGDSLQSSQILLSSVNGICSLSLSLLFLRIRARKTDDWRSVNSQDLPCGGPRKVLPTPADKCVSSRSGKIHSAAGPK